MRATLAGGGTGGHVIPALAIARELQQRYQAEVLFIGTARGIENRLVPAAAVHFEETKKYFRNARVTGVPVREEFFLQKEAAGWTTQTLLVFGGSQGASAINRVVLESLSGLRQALPGLHIIHQTGERDHKDAQAAYLQAGISAEVLPFINEMPQA